MDQPSSLLQGPIEVSGGLQEASCTVLALAVLWELPGMGPLLPQPASAKETLPLGKPFFCRAPPLKIPSLGQDPSPKETSSLGRPPLRRQFLCGDLSHKEILPLRKLSENIPPQRSPSPQKTPSLKETRVKLRTVGSVCAPGQPKAAMTLS